MGNKWAGIRVFGMNMSSHEKTYLFVCLANMNRSPTAASVFRALAKAGGMQVKALSAGVSPLARKPVTKELTKTADLIFVMEDYMKKEIQGNFHVEPGKIIVLNIPDIYDSNDPVLVKQLRDKLMVYSGT
jgi:predicted protein tyrosine phosphatase